MSAILSHVVTALISYCTKNSNSYSLHEYRDPMYFYRSCVQVYMTCLTSEASSDQSALSPEHGLHRGVRATRNPHILVVAHPISCRPHLIRGTGGRTERGGRAEQWVRVGPRHRQAGSKRRKRVAKSGI